jgi:very-short-patch-repair endonuclease
MSRIHDPLLTILARELREHRTRAEGIFWEVVRNRNIRGYKFKRQIPILWYIVDFYCAELKLAIELDGDVHLETKEHDAYRTEKLKRLGMTVIRYTNEQVIKELVRVVKHLDLVIDSIESRPSPDSDLERG